MKRIVYRLEHCANKDGSPILRSGVCCDEQAAMLATVKPHLIVSEEPTAEAVPTLYFCPDCGELHGIRSYFDMIEHRLDVIYNLHCAEPGPGEKWPLEVEEIEQVMRTLACHYQDEWRNGGLLAMPLKDFHALVESIRQPRKHARPTLRVVNGGLAA